MLDQSFTYKNLLRIYDRQNRKGVNLEGLFFPEVEKSTLRINEAKSLLKTLYSRKAKYGADVFHERVKKIYRIIRSLKEKKDEIIKIELDYISSKILSGKITFTLKQNYLPGHTKPIYKIDSDPGSFFAEKQVQSNIENTYHVKQSNRDVIIPQIRAQLESNFPKYLIKTDIKQFYESIDRELLLKKLNSNPLLSLTTRKLVTKILKNFDKYTPHKGSKKGIPRGIGISAYLAELYMQEFDEKIRRLPDLIYYSRYVDDIVVIFAPTPGSNLDIYFSCIENLVSAERLTLSPEKEKTLKLNLMSGGQNFKFDYLGYSFEKNKKNLSLSFSQSKELKYRKRINEAFSEYKAKRFRYPQHSRRLLLKRIRYLTGNTKLFNNKGSAFIGVYHSNKWINQLNALHRLDRFLEGRVSMLSDSRLKRRLYRNSFVSGFSNKTFRKFRPLEMSEIVKVWKL